MSKKRSRSKKNRVTRQRVNPRFHRDPRDLLPVSVVFDSQKAPVAKPKAQKLGHDRRYYMPDILKRTLLYGRKDKVARVTIKNRNLQGKSYKRTPRQGFVDAKRNEVCRRRSNRRELLFKRGKVGKGVRIRTKKRLNQFSKVRCT